MKKTIAALFVLLSAVVFAGANDLLIMFYTPGPDKYADGSVVLDGERYSLVYTAANGAQTSVLTVSIAKDGKCPPVLFSVDEKEVAEKYSGGSWGVYLLDTRDFAKDAGGKTLSGLDAEGQPTVVNVKATVGDGIASAGGFESAASSTGVAAGTYDLTNIPQPKVAGIKIDGANVIVTVKDTVPFVGYTLQSGADVKSFAVPAGATALNGNASGEINLVAPKKDGAQFFKVSTIK